MADDPFNSFRERFAPKGPATPAAAPSPALVVNRLQGKEAYQAFAAKDKVRRLDVRCGKSGMAHAVSYNYLLNLSYNRKTYSEFFITVSGLTVMVKGRGLRPIVDAIKLHTCEFIQEFDAEDFESPADTTEPFIETITVEVMRGVAPGTQEKTAKQA